MSDDYFDQKEKAIKDGHAFKCILLSEDTYWEKSIVFSGLPIMKINGLNDNYNRLSDLTFLAMTKMENIMYFHQNLCIMQEVQLLQCMQKEL